MHVSLAALGSDQALVPDVNREILDALERLKTVGWIGLGISVLVLFIVFWGKRS